MHRRVLAAGIVLVAVLLLLGSPGWAAPLFQARSVISYPTEGQTVSGIVEIKGTATHPNMNFYQLRYAPGPEETGDSQWVDFAIVEGQQVEGDVLALWDTSLIPDGQYTLAMAVWGTNDSASPYVTFVRRLTVNNAQPVPSPTPEGEQPTPEPLATAESGPTPTPVSVEQPATATPRATATPQAPGEEGGGEAEVLSGDEGSGGFTAALAGMQSKLRSAFCSGGIIAVMLFLLWGLYLLAKISVRWYIRQSRNVPRE